MKKGNSCLKGTIHVGFIRNDKVYYDSFHVSCNGILMCILTLASVYLGLSSLVPGSVFIQFLIISLDSSSVVLMGSWRSISDPPARNVITTEASEPELVFPLVSCIWSSPVVFSRCCGWSGLSDVGDFMMWPSLQGCSVTSGDFCCVRMYEIGLETGPHARDDLQLVLVDVEQSHTPLSVTLPLELRIIMESSSRIPP